MADSLHQPLNNLRLRPMPQHSLYQKPNKDPALPIELTIPRINTYGRRMYYGFHITQEWAINYGRRESRRRRYDPGPPPTDLFDVSIALTILSETTGIHKLTYREVYDQDEPFLPRGTRPTFPIPETCTQILAICSSSSQWFEKRPTQVQVDKLKHIMGGKEPMWWVARG